VLLLSCAANADSLHLQLNSALQNNHKIIAIQHHYDSVEAKIDLAGGLPDPQFKLGVSLQPIETRLGAQTHSVSISQKIPMWGKRGLQNDQQQHLIKVEHAHLGKVKAEVLGNIVVNWWKLATLDYTISKTIEYRKLVEAQLEVAEAGYSSGGNYSDIIDVKLSNELIADSVAELQLKRTPLIAKITALTTLTSIHEPEWVKWEPVMPELEVIIGELEKAPELLVVSEKSQVAEKAVQLAGKRKLPDLTTGIDWIAIDKRDIVMEDNGSDAVIARVGFNLPIWSKQNRATEKVALAHLASVKSFEKNTRLKLVSNLETLVAECESAVRRHKLYSENLIPEAEEAVKIIRASYESGYSSFVDLINAQKRVLNYELEYSKACLDGRTATAEINIILGKLPEGI
jgi:outer membrane protein, heavy metal efflux system